MKHSRNYPVYTVTKKAEHSIALGHPWVYAEEITHLPDEAPENGALVDVVSSRGSYLGTGMLSLTSKIRVRLLSRNANDTFDARRTSAAAASSSERPTSFPASPWTVSRISW